MLNLMLAMLSTARSSFRSRRELVLENLALRADEMYFGTGAGVVDELRVKREAARERRLLENRRTSCAICPRVSDGTRRAAA